MNDPNNLWISWEDFAKFIGGLILVNLAILGFIKLIELIYHTKII